MHERSRRSVLLRMSAEFIRPDVREHQPMRGAAVSRGRHLYLGPRLQLHMSLPWRSLWAALRTVRRMRDDGVPTWRTVRGECVSLH